MSTQIKLYLGRKVLDSLDKAIKLSPVHLQALLQISNSHNPKIEVKLPLATLERHLGITNTNEILKIQPDHIIKNVHLVSDRAERSISFEVDRSLFMKDVVEHCAEPDVNFNPRTIVVEYSSPNIAKPFHLGHLRSTIIGNFISNISNFTKNQVTRLNYLGDWGTQFGLIKVGVDVLKITPEMLKQNPVKLLYQSYVHANSLAEKDETILKRAKEEFAKLEQGSQDDLKQWSEFMGYTKNELEATYKRLGVTFDEYNYESMYGAKQIQEVIHKLRTIRVLEKHEDGREFIRINDRKVTLVKSDGSTLYLTRDVAAAIDRYNKYKFDRMYYVVENGQNLHFNALSYILDKMDLPWANRLHHVKFGRIHGLSTRKGNVVFLSDILDETKELMLKKQIESPNTKVPVDDERTTDILGVSCVIINDLKQRRQKDYAFDWDQALQVKGDTGVKLQYTHCRLYSLEKNSGVIAAAELNPEILHETEVLNLLKELAKFHYIVHLAHEQLEAMILVKYLFHLCNHISKALKTLNVKGSEPDVASQRLLVFNTARKVLGNGMSILGLTPLNEM